MKVRWLKDFSSDADDLFRVSGGHNVSVNVALFLIAAGWARAELRLADDRRHRVGPGPTKDRRRKNRRRVPTRPPIALRRNPDKYAWVASLLGATPSNNPMQFIFVTIFSLVVVILVYATLRPSMSRPDHDVGAASEDWRAQQRRLSDEH
jgi:hypothetical protein